MSRKIAIVINRDVYSQYGDDCERVIDSITEWETVTDEEYRALVNGQAWFNYHLIEQPTEPRKFIENTIKAWKKKVADEEVRRERERKEREEKAAQRKYKKELKDKESKKKLLEKLRVELGES